MSPKLRKLIPDEALFRRRAGDEPLRDLARSGPIRGADWRATDARRSVPACVDEFAIHSAAIGGFLKRAQSLRLEERVGLRVAIERQRKEGLSVSESVPNLREAARRLAELIIDQLKDADSNLSATETQELEALIWKQLPNP